MNIILNNIKKLFLCHKKISPHAFIRTYHFNQKIYQGYEPKSDYLYDGTFVSQPIPQ